MFDKPFRHRFFLLFILLFAYVQSIYTRVLVRQEINVYTFTPEAAVASLLEAGILFLIILFFIKRWRGDEVFNTRNVLLIFISSLIAFVLTKQGIGFLIAWSFDKIAKNYAHPTFILNLFTDLLDGVIYGSFFLSYFYFNRNRRHQERVSFYHKALSESRINHLKSQLNPHFLFNNLNVLDQLIEEDKRTASDFLNEFAEIYRYVLQASDQELIPLEEELDFAQRYCHLIQYKYGDAYQLRIEGRHESAMVVPLTVQLLIENAVKHNLGTATKPIKIIVRIDQDMRVSNNIQRKRSTISSGLGLNNLKEQYAFLTEKPISIIRSDDQFSVHIPILKDQ